MEDRLHRKRKEETRIRLKKEILRPGKSRIIHCYKCRKNRKQGKEGKIESPPKKQTKKRKTKIKQ